MLRLSKRCLRCIPIGLSFVCLLAVRPIRAATNPTIAYMDPADVGNQSFTGTLGQNFTVNGAAITVSQLGVFDSGQNGITGTLEVAIFSSTGTQVTPTETFTGTAGTLVDGDRFLALATPITLGPGNYQLTTTGWGQDLNGNRACNDNLACGSPLPLGGPFNPPTLNTGNGLVTYTGIGFLAGGGLQLVPTAPGLPGDEFNAGSFVFAPEPSTAILLAVGLLLLVLAPRLRRQPTE